MNELWTESFRVNELTVMNERLKVQVTEKDKNIATLQRSVASLETRVHQGGEIQAVDGGMMLGASPDMDLSITEREEITSMHEALRRIAQEVIADADQSQLDDVGDPELSTRMLRASSPLRAAKGRRSRSASPVRGPPGFADSTYSAVQAALNKRQLQVGYGCKYVDC